MENLIRASIRTLPIIAGTDTIVDAQMIFDTFAQVFRVEEVLLRLNRTVKRTMNNESASISLEEQNMLLEFLLDECSAPFRFETDALDFYIVMMRAVYRHIMVRINCEHEGEEGYSYRTEDFSNAMNKYYRAFLVDLYGG